jgi:hypothetical protein
LTILSQVVDCIYNHLEVNNFQRVGSVSNAQVGCDFETAAQVTIDNYNSPGEIIVVDHSGVFPEARGVAG